MAEYKEWQIKHSEVISSFLKHLNSQTDDFILKGGTALMACYGLDRFSEDIYLDGKNESIGKYVADFCEKENFSFRVAKDTDTVKRYMIHYGDIGKPLKIEVSFRKKAIAHDEFTKIDDITVYTIDNLCAMKVNAYIGRDKLRDLYDLSFICKRYWDTLPAALKIVIRNAIEHKGIEQFDYITREQQDDLIDKDKLADDFLTLYDKLGLLYDENEKKIIDEGFKKTDSANSALSASV
jgi:predicted nucleotidyltransferase component of viral defense system